MKVIYLLLFVTLAVAQSSDDGTGTVLDDFSSAFSFTSNTYTTDNSRSNALVTVRRMNIIPLIGQTSTVSYTTRDGSARAGIDYVPISGTLTFPQDDFQSRVLMIPLLIPNTTSTVKTKLFVVSLLNPVLATLAVPKDTMVQLNQVPFDQGAIQFDSSSQIVPYQSGGVYASVSRSGGSNGLVRVNCTTFDGTATSIRDYNKTSVVLVWNAGDLSSRQVFIPFKESTTAAAQLPVGSTDLAINFFVALSMDSTNSAGYLGEKSTDMILITNQPSVIVLSPSSTGSSGPTSSSTGSVNTSPSSTGSNPFVSSTGWQSSTGLESLSSSGSGHDDSSASSIAPLPFVYSLLLLLCSFLSL
jgi:hypothetical protein